MITRQTLILMTLTVVVFLYLAAFEWERSAALRPEIPSLPVVDTGMVRAVELRQGTNLFRVARGQEGWEIKQPFTYPARASRVEALLEALTALQPTRHIPTGKETQLNQFGLQPPRMLLRLESFTTNQEIRLGALTLLRDKVYLTASGAPGVFVVPVHFLNTLPREMDNWRDPRLADLGTAREKLDNLTVAANGQLLLALQRNATNGVWRLLQEGQPLVEGPLKLPKVLKPGGEFDLTIELGAEDGVKIAAGLLTGGLRRLRGEVLVQLDTPWGEALVRSHLPLP